MTFSRTLSSTVIIEVGPSTRRALVEWDEEKISKSLTSLARTRSGESCENGRHTPELERAFIAYPNINKNFLYIQSPVRFRTAFFVQDGQFRCLESLGAGFGHDVGSPIPASFCVRAVCNVVAEQDVSVEPPTTVVMKLFSTHSGPRSSMAEHAFGVAGSFLSAPFRRVSSAKPCACNLFVMSTSQSQTCFVMSTSQSQTCDQRGEVAHKSRAEQNRAEKR
eukprot:578075-Rhodomonas_salina.1